MRTDFGMLLCAITCRIHICSRCMSRLKNDSQKAQKRLCCWVLFLVAFLWALYYWSDLLTTSLRVLWNSRAWRKMSFRYSFFRCLYPCQGERLECMLRFGRFPSRLKLSAASIWVARNRNAKGGHLVHFAPGINWPRIYRRARCTSRTCGARSGSPRCAKSNVDAQRRLSFAAVR